MKSSGIIIIQKLTLGLSNIAAPMALAKSRSRSRMNSFLRSIAFMTVPIKDYHTGNFSNNVIRGCRSSFIATRHIIKAVA
jgi:hypothetical protein